MFPIRHLPADYGNTHSQGIYISVATSIAAHQYMLHQSIDCSEGELPVVVHLTPIDAEFRAHAPKHCLQMTLKQSAEKTLCRLPKDLPRLFRGNQRKIFISLREKDIQDWTNYFSTYASELKKFSEKKQYCIHFIIYSEHESSFCSTLLSFNSLISGISVLNLSVSQPYYQIIYWSTPNSVGSNKRFGLEKNETNWTVSAGKDQHALRCDQHEWLFDKTVFSTSNLTPSPRWQLYDGMQALTEAAMQKRYASVCFSLHHNTSIHELARTLHALRQHAGANLKIVVYEQDGLIRHSDTQLLLDAGANVLIPKNTSITHLLSIIEQLQSLTYERHTIHDIDAYLTTHTPPQQKGFVPIAVFQQHVQAALQQPVSNALIRLQPHSRLSPAQAVSNLNLQRNGDFFTITDNEVYLFLYGCHPQMVLATLNHLFRMRWQELFSHYFSAIEPTAIAKQIAKLASATLPEMPKLIGANQHYAASPQTASAPAASTPQRYTPMVQPLV